MHPPGISDSHVTHDDVRKEKIQTPESSIDPTETQFSRSAVEQAAAVRVQVQECFILKFTVCSKLNWTGKSSRPIEVGGPTRLALMIVRELTLPTHTWH